MLPFLSLGFTQGQAIQNTEKCRAGRPATRCVPFGGGAAQSSRAHTGGPRCRSCPPRSAQRSTCAVGSCSQLGGTVQGQGQRPAARRSTCRRSPPLLSGHAGHKQRLRHKRLMAAWQVHTRCALTLLLSLLLLMIALWPQCLAFIHTTAPWPQCSAFVHTIALWPQCLAFAHTTALWPQCLAFAHTTALWSQCSAFAHTNCPVAPMLGLRPHDCPGPNARPSSTRLPCGPNARPLPTRLPCGPNARPSSARLPWPQCLTCSSL